MNFIIISVNYSLSSSANLTLVDSLPATTTSTGPVLATLHEQPVNRMDDTGLQRLLLLGSGLSGEKIVHLCQFVFDTDLCGAMLYLS